MSYLTRLTSITASWYTVPASAYWLKWAPDSTTPYWILFLLSNSIPSWNTEIYDVLSYHADPHTTSTPLSFTMRSSSHELSLDPVFDISFCPDPKLSSHCLSASAFSSLDVCPSLSKITLTSLTLTPPSLISDVTVPAFKDVSTRMRLHDWDTEKFAGGIVRYRVKSIFAGFETSDTFVFVRMTFDDIRPYDVKQFTLTSFRAIRTLTDMKRWRLRGPKVTTVKISSIEMKRMSSIMNLMRLTRPTAFILLIICPTQHNSERLKRSREISWKTLLSSHLSLRICSSKSRSILTLKFAILSNKIVRCLKMHGVFQRLSPAHLTRSLIEHSTE